MKKTLLAASILTGGLAFSQVAQQERAQELIPAGESVTNLTSLNANVAPIPSTGEEVDAWHEFAIASSALQSGTSSGWYVSPVFPDTTVYAQGASSNYRPFRHMYGQVLDLSSTYLSILGSQPELNDSYTYDVDSLRLRYHYYRPQTTNPDTLELQFFYESDMTEGAFVSGASFIVPDYDHTTNDGVNPFHVQQILLDDSKTSTSINTRLEVAIDGVKDIPGSEVIAVAVKFIPGNAYSTDDLLSNNGTTGINNFLVGYYLDEESVTDGSLNQMMLVGTGNRYNDANLTSFTGQFTPGNAFANSIYQAGIAFGVTVNSNYVVLESDSVCTDESVSMHLGDSANYSNESWTLTGPETLTGNGANPEFVFQLPGTYDLTVSATRNGETEDSTIVGAITVTQSPSATFTQSTFTISVSDTATFTLPTPTLTPDTALGFYFSDYSDYFGDINGDALSIGSNEILYAISNGDCIEFETVTLIIEEDTNGGGNGNGDGNGDGNGGGTTSIEELAAEVSVYPNPVKDQLFIQGLNLESVDQVNVFTVTGSKVQAELAVTEGAINVATLAKGVYMIQVVEGNNVFTKRFVKE